MRDTRVETHLERVQPEDLLDERPSKKREDRRKVSREDVQDRELVVAMRLGDSRLVSATGCRGREDEQIHLTSERNPRYRSKPSLPSKRSISCFIRDMSVESSIVSP